MKNLVSISTLAVLIIAICLTALITNRKQRARNGLKKWRMKMANEKRLIDANDALERLKKAEKEMKVVSLCGCKAVPMDGVIEFVASRPTVDAVEVVRCKDCEYAACNPVKLTPFLDF